MSERRAASIAYATEETGSAITAKAKATSSIGRLNRAARRRGAGAGAVGVSVCKEKASRIDNCRPGFPAHRGERYSQFAGRDIRTAQRQSHPMRPGPVMKRAFRAPAFLYTIGVGWIYGHRFLLLTHLGRRSGRVYRTMLEVISWDPEKEEAVVMSGFGKRSNWYRNTLAGKAIEIQISRQRFKPHVRELDPVEATRVIGKYEGRNRLLRPALRRTLSRLAGFHVDDSEAARRKLVEELPLVAFSPHPPSADTTNTR